jgi:sensor histidine kinase YesM
MNISFLIAVFETTMGMKTVLWYYTLTNRFKHQITHGSFAQAFICIIIVETTIFLSERSIYKLKYSMQMSDLSSVMSMLSNRSRQYCILSESVMGIITNHAVLNVSNHLYKFVASACNYCKTTCKQHILSISSLP